MEGGFAIAATFRYPGLPLPRMPKSGSEVAAEVVAAAAIVIALSIGVLLTVVNGVGDEGAAEQTSTGTKRHTTRHPHSATAGSPA